jgi:hypothetical protein
MRASSLHQKRYWTTVVETAGHGWAVVGVRLE